MTMTRETFEEISKLIEVGKFYLPDWCGSDVDDIFDFGREFGAFEASKNHAAEIAVVKKKAYDSGIQDLRDVQSGNWR